MTKEITREDLIDTKYDVREWTVEQKTQFQVKCFELGFAWGDSYKAIDYVDNFPFYFVRQRSGMTQTISEGFFIDCPLPQKYFTDIFPEEKETKTSVFNHHRTWVTASEDFILKGILELVGGKDYKVLEVEGDILGTLFLVLNELGVPEFYCEGHFDTITADDVLQNVFPYKKDNSCEVEVGVGSFDDLVYVAPEECVQMRISTLTEEQADFLKENLDWRSDYDPELAYIFFDIDDLDCYCVNGNYTETKITFNDIFVHKSQLED